MLGIYEYCGRQRCGKSTLMMCDLVSKVLGEFAPEDVYSNFRIKIDGVHCMCNAELISAVLGMKAEKVRHKVVMFDEVGQELKARSYTDKRQTEFVNFCWQMPKRDILLMYCSNPGNSADVIMRDATWQTVLPVYHEGLKREDDYIEASVIFNYDLRMMRGVRVYGVASVQELFDSFEPIE